jgi:kynurenine formamidase
LARWLLEHRSIHGIGIDTASLDCGTSTRFRGHYIFCFFEAEITLQHLFFARFI